MTLKLRDFYEAFLKEDRGVVFHPSSSGDQDLEVLNISYDSREVGSSCLFFCKGVNFKKDYLDQARDKGAIAYVSEKDYDLDIPWIEVPNIRDVLAPAGSLFYGTPQEDLTIFAMTGTKGKTTTAVFLHAILDLWEKKEGRRAGLLSTSHNFDGCKKGAFDRSTPEPFELYEFLNRCRNNGVRLMVMEVSSQALKYKRTGGLSFQEGAFLNIGLDHISPTEHKDFEDYFASKLLIFKQTKTAFVNLDSAHAQEVWERAGECPNRVSLAIGHEADYQITKVNDEGWGLRVSLKGPGGEKADLKLAMPGQFNGMNALVAYAMARTYGVDIPTIQKALAPVRVPGRMDGYQSKDGRLLILVDYAHNGLSFKTLFDYLKKNQPPAYRLAVWGVGDHKTLNRPKDLAQEAGPFVDHNILTLDESFQDELADINARIGAYIDQAGGSWESVEDRPEAINHAYDLALEALKTHDHVQILLLGKGAEETIVFRGILRPYRPDSSRARDLIVRYDQDHPGD